jgi:purine-cytosine permease-like protein
MLIGGLSIYLLSPSHPKWLVCAIVGLVLTTPVLVGYALVGRLFRRSDPRF